MNLTESVKIEFVTPEDLEMEVPVVVTPIEIMMTQRKGRGDTLMSSLPKFIMTPPSEAKDVRTACRSKRKASFANNAENLQLLSLKIKAPPSEAIWGLSCSSYIRS